MPKEDFMETHSRISSNLKIPQVSTDGPITYVIGHKNPDSDSVLSAISYTALLRQLYPQNFYVAAAAGPITAQTRYILDRFKMDHPEIIWTSHRRLASLDRPNLITINETDSIARALELYAKFQFKVIPVVNSEGSFSGFLSLTDIFSSFLRPRTERELRMVYTSVGSILSAVKGKYLGKPSLADDVPTHRLIYTLSISYSSFIELTASMTPEDWKIGIFVVGYHISMIQYLVEKSAGVIIISKESKINLMTDDYQGTDFCSDSENDMGETDSQGCELGVCLHGSGIGDVESSRNSAVLNVSFSEESSHMVLKPDDCLNLSGGNSSSQNVHDIGEVASIKEANLFGSGRKRKVLPDDLVKAINESSTTVIVTPLAVSSTTLLVKQSTPVTEYINRDQSLIVNENAKLSDVRAKLNTAKHAHAICVVDKANNRPIGVITRMDLLKSKMRRVILMDHNEFSQSVDGIKSDGVEVVEIVDHHRLGTNTTVTPIKMTVRTVGSTCTIVAGMYREHGIIPSPEIASLLLSGIMCDTLILRSPTTTRIDIVTAENLAKLTGLRIQELGPSIFNATSPLVNCEDKVKLIKTDYKLYTVDGTDKNIAVAQVETTSLEALTPTLIRELQETLADLRETEKLWAIALLITDVVTSNSILMCEGPLTIRDAMGYPNYEDYDMLFEMKGVVSRKKQLLPHLMAVLPLAVN
ncbi:Manganese-dependent inorganic pyrophosphatase/ putative DHHA2 domain protein [Giardia duodenalis assemblage B]|uniref:inorganic diphosphatase n=1 Tax=Giardia duodenalis assemblage B TaxID=1394984 RepID=A0A132P032_GIAIN|nr:Manganese-dependent inorganic pyrophosphatase/ putative DHHA2 domain protein [Giardia intestinalis assemblage B]